ncbi:MAG: anhydro-N-acetylmuramic acid kinase, partial [Bacteroidia bacterium]
MHNNTEFVIFAKSIKNTNISTTNTYRIIGLMSGTSLDGLDIAACIFTKKSGGWGFEIEASECIAYPQTWLDKLQMAPALNGYELTLLHKNYGFYLADAVNDFITKHNIRPQLISSHGHTIYHEPKKYLSLQIGDGAALYARTQFPVVCDFRSADVCMHGQGAPLVPVGDKLLFADFDFCLNLGGIANISFDNNDGKRIAFDISPCNLILNLLAKELGFEYDKGGETARNAKVDEALLQQLNQWEYYNLEPPKSLDKEALLEELMPLINEANISIANKLATVTFHIARQIAAVVNTQIHSKFSIQNPTFHAFPYKQQPENALRLLATGGGAFNKYLMDNLQQLTQ